MLPDQLLLVDQGMKTKWTSTTVYYFDFIKKVCISLESSRGNWQPHDPFELQLDISYPDVNKWGISTLKRFGYFVEEEVGDWDSLAIKNGRLPKDFKENFTPSYCQITAEEQNLFIACIPKNTAIRFSPFIINYWTRLPVYVFRRWDACSDISFSEIDEHYRSLPPVKSNGDWSHSALCRIVDIQKTKEVVSNLWNQLSPSQFLVSSRINKDESKNPRGELLERLLRFTERPYWEVHTDLEVKKLRSIVKTKIIPFICKHKKIRIKKKEKIKKPKKRNKNLI
mgnify:FL=1